MKNMPLLVALLLPVYAQAACSPCDAECLSNPYGLAGSYSAEKVDVVPSK